MTDLPSRDTPTYRPDINGLRAVAVLAVIAFHSFPRLAPGGFVGVDVFFVISGFLISRLILERLQGGPFRLKDFYERRIRRIFPALTPMLVCVLVVGWILATPAEYASLGKHAVAGSLFSSNILLRTEADYFDREAQAKELLHLWSLGVEEPFYILWPLFLAAFWRRRLGVTAFGAVSLAAGVLWSATFPTFSFYLPFTRFWELAVGALLAHATVVPQAPGAEWLKRMAEHQSSRRDLLSVVGLAAIGASIFLLREGIVFPGVAALLPVAGSAAVIAAGPSALGNRVLATRLFVGIGLISYPLYLWHWPLLVFVRNANFENLSIESRVVRVVLMASAFALAIATYAIEKRICHARGAVRPLVASMVGVLAAGVAVIHHRRGGPPVERGTTARRGVRQASGCRFTRGLPLRHLLPSRGSAGREHEPCLPSQSSGSSFDVPTSAPVARGG